MSLRLSLRARSLLPTLHTQMGACFSSSSASSFNWAGEPRVSTPDGVKAAKAALEVVVKDFHCGPLLLRLAWHDAGTYDKV